MNAWVHGREICITKTFMVPKKKTFMWLKLLLFLYKIKYRLNNSGSY